jgi:hypothetical protein
MTFRETARSKSFVMALLYTMLTMKNAIKVITPLSLRLT